MLEDFLVSFVSNPSHSKLSLIICPPESQNIGSEELSGIQFHIPTRPLSGWVWLARLGTTHDGSLFFLFIKIYQDRHDNILAVRCRGQLSWTGILSTNAESGTRPFGPVHWLRPRIASGRPLNWWTFERKSILLGRLYEFLELLAPSGSKVGKSPCGLDMLYISRPA